MCSYASFERSDTMTAEDIQLGKRITAAVAALPDAKREFILGYAEGVMAVSQQQAAQQAAERG